MVFVVLPWTASKNYFTNRYYNVYLTVMHMFKIHLGEKKMLSKPFHMEYVLWGTIYPDKEAHQNPPMANAVFGLKFKLAATTKGGKNKFV